MPGISRWNYCNYKVLRTQHFSSYTPCAVEDTPPTPSKIPRQAISVGTQTTVLRPPHSIFCCAEHSSVDDLLNSCVMQQQLTWARTKHSHSTAKVCPRVSQSDTRTVYHLYWFIYVTSVSQHGQNTGAVILQVNAGTAIWPVVHTNAPVSQSSVRMLSVKTVISSNVNNLIMFPSTISVLRKPKAQST